MKLRITTYDLETEIVPGTVKSYWPLLPGTDPVVADETDPDCGQYVVLLGATAPDALGYSGRVVVLTPAFEVREVPSVSVGVWVS